MGGGWYSSHVRVSLGTNVRGSCARLSARTRESYNIIIMNDYYYYYYYYCLCRRVPIENACVCATSRAENIYRVCIAYNPSGCPGAATASSSASAIPRHRAIPRADNIILLSKTRRSFRTVSLPFHRVSRACGYRICRIGDLSASPLPPDRRAE